MTSDLQELRVSDRENVVLPWSQVREVRDDAGRRSTRAVVEMQNRRVVPLPEGLDVARVRQWQHEAFMGPRVPGPEPDVVSGPPVAVQLPGPVPSVASQ